MRENNEESFGLLKLQADEFEEPAREDEPSVENKQHHVSKEYLQCEPVDLDENLEIQR